MVDYEIVEHGNVDLVEKCLDVHSPPLLSDFASETSQQGALVDARRQRRIYRRHRCSQVCKRFFGHPLNMMPFAESLNGRVRRIVNFDPPVDQLTH